MRRVLATGWRNLRLAGRSDDRAAIERLIPLLHHPKGTSGTIQWRGRKLRFLDGASIYYQLAEIYLSKVYDFSISDTTPRPYILDVGANIGLAAIRFRELHPQAEIICFEADPDLASVVNENLAVRDDERTRVISAAAWTLDGMLGFAGVGDDSGHIDDTSDRRVPCVDLASFIDRPVDFLKIDIEGAEYELLTHLHEKGCLAHVRRLFVEMHLWRDEGASRFHEALSILAACGMNYRIMSSETYPHKAGWAELPQTSNLVCVHAWRDETS